MKPKIKEIDGVLCEVDEKGMVIKQYKPSKQKEKNIKEGKPIHKFADDSIHLVEMEDGKKVWMQKGLNADLLPRKDWPFSEQVAKAILRNVQEGKTLTQLSRMEGFPPLHIMYHWRRKYKEFREELERAREDSADTFNDKIIEFVEKVNSDKDVQVARLKTELLQWAAKQANKERYGQKKASEKQEQSNIQIFIETGVPEKEVKSEALPRAKDILAKYGKE